MVTMLFCAAMAESVDSYVASPATAEAFARLGSVSFFDIQLYVATGCGIAATVFAMHQRVCLRAFFLGSQQSDSQAGDAAACCRFMIDRLSPARPRAPADVKAGAITACARRYKPHANDERFVVQPYFFCDAFGP